MDVSQPRTPSLSLPEDENLASIVTLVERFVDDGDESALETCLNLVAGARIDLFVLLQSLDGIEGDVMLKRRAIASVRARLGLAVIPGAVCRPCPR